MSKNQKKVETSQISPYMGFKDASRAIEFYIKAFDAKERYRLTEPSGRIGHAEVCIGRATIMLSDEYPDFGAVSAQTLGGCPIALQLYVTDVDAVVARAVKAGATVLRPVKDEFYGDRAGQIADPFGYKWMIATRNQDMSPQEMQRRWSEMMASAEA
jgi:PhnB protein